MPELYEAQVAGLPESLRCSLSPRHILESTLRARGDMSEAILQELPQLDDEDIRELVDRYARAADLMES